MVNNDDIVTYLHEFKDDELRKIIYTEYREYNEEVVQAAKNELYGRYESNFWEADNLMLGELINYCDFDEVSEKLLELYPREKKRISKYEVVFNKLKSFEKIDSKEIRVSAKKVKEPLIQAYWDVYGIDIKTKEKVAIEYCKWSEWALFLVDKKLLQSLGKEAYVVHCLRKMTVEGFDEEEIQKMFIEIEKVSENYVLPDEFDFVANDVSTGIFISQGIRRRKEFK
jgi:hypothetical protein